MARSATSPSAFTGASAQANLLLPGLYAWVTTVLVPASSARATKFAQLAAALSLLSLLAGAAFRTRATRASRGFGIHLFIGTSTACWLLLARAGVPLAPQPFDAALGALGWTLYTFGWGELRERKQVPESDPTVLPGPPLTARHPWPRSTEFVLGIGVLGCFLFAVLAFRVDRPGQAAMAHGLSLLLALGLLGSTVEVALGRRPRELGGSAERFNRAATPLALLAMALGLSAVFWILER